MKDAKGHGSDARGGSTSHIKTAGLRGVGISNTFRATPKPMPGDAARTVFGLRQQMQKTGAGHKTGLMQAIKNFLGG